MQDKVQITAAISHNGLNLGHDKVPIESYSHINHIKDPITRKPFTLNLSQNAMKPNEVVAESIFSLCKKVDIELDCN